LIIGANLMRAAGTNVCGVLIIFSASITSFSVISKPSEVECKESAGVVSEQAKVGAEGDGSTCALVSEPPDDENDVSACVVMSKPLEVENDKSTGVVVNKSPDVEKEE